ncbi:MAG TPA: S8 family serine peptidase [Ramlibacter sp.]|nr:S8 family serine peptidase [Ramlibacter sp.]
MPPTPHHASFSSGTVTTVQLPSSVAKRRAFLAALQSALGGRQVLGNLSPGPADDVFVIPAPAEELLRASPALAGDAQWQAQLQAWGALAVNTLSTSSLLALTRRGGLPTTAGLQPAKLSSPLAAPVGIAAAATTTLPPAFQGPFDWHLDTGGVNVAKAWELFSGSPQFAGALPWAGIKVGHVDTGYTEHAALGWSAGASPTVDVPAGHDFWDDDPDARDEMIPGFPGHGTRISATIAGFLAGGAGRPYYGAAPGVQIVPYRVTDSVGIDHVTRHVAAAIREAVADGCQVINVSLGALFHHGHLSDAIDFAYDNGVITVCAAGNVWKEVIYPGRYNRCITMGGIGPGRKPWSGSAKGIYVDLCAPADRMRRVKAQALPPGTAGSMLEPHDDGDGTSYATALCSGVAALWLAWHGPAALQARYAAGGKWQVAAAFKALLRATALVPAGWDSTEYGSGVIDAAALLGAALPADGVLTAAKAAADVFDDLND